MIGSDTIGYEVRTLDNLLFRMLLAYSAKAGMDELTMMHGWIIGYLYDNREKEIYQKDLEKKFSISRSTVTNILKRMESKRIYPPGGCAGGCQTEEAGSDGGVLRLHWEKEALICQMNEELKGTLDPEETEQFLRTARKMKGNIRQILCRMGVLFDAEGAPSGCEISVLSPGN